METARENAINPSFSKIPPILDFTPAANFTGRLFGRVFFRAFSDWGRPKNKDQNEAPYGKRRGGGGGWICNGAGPFYANFENSHIASTGYFGAISYRSRRGGRYPPTTDEVAFCKRTNGRDKTAKNIAQEAPQDLDVRYIASDYIKLQYCTLY